MTRGSRLLVISHPAVLPVNQLVYAELVERGWHVDLVVPDRWTHEYGLVGPEPLPTLAERFHPLPVLLPGRPQRHAYRVRPGAVLRRLQPDVVFLEQEPFSVSALQWAVAADREGAPFGVQADENLDRRLPTPVKAWRSWVLRRAAFVAARSESAGRLAEQWGATGDVQLVPHHVPSWQLVDPPHDDTFRVGFAGRLVPEKGIEVLVDAVRRLDGDVELVVAGDGPLREWLEGAELGGASLRLLSNLGHDDMAEAYGRMDVLALPSLSTPRWTEQFGRVLVEALWCGVPVVGSDSGEIPWMVTTTGGGHVVPEGDASALAAMLDELRANPEKRRHLADRGREAVEATFGVAAVADSLEAVLQSAASPVSKSDESGDTRPQVALVAHGIHDHGGMERACAELIRHGHEEMAFVVVAAELAPELRPLVERWVRIRVPSRPIPLKFLAFFLRAGFALRRLDVDLVHTVGAIVPNRADVATVQFCHAGHRGVTGRIAPARAPLLRRANTTVARALALVAERWCYRPPRLRSFAAVSHGVAEELDAHYPGIATTVTPNGVDTERFRPDPVVRAEMRAEGGLGEQACVALFVGGDWSRKGLDLAIEGVAKARTEGADITLWVVGPGDESRFRALAGRLGVADRVAFFGRRADTERFHQAADLFVFPTTYEAFSLVTLEAAASGLPLVVPFVNGVAELVGADEAGLIVERTASSVATALAALAGSSSRRAALGVEAQRRAAAFTWERSDRAVLDLYRELLETGAVTRSGGSPT